MRGVLEVSLDGPNAGEPVVRTCQRLFGGQDCGPRRQAIVGRAWVHVPDHSGIGDGWKGPDVALERDREQVLAPINA